MKDRVSKYPGRALITPEDGSAPFYATITRADEPTQPGDPMSKVTFLKDATAVRLRQNSDATPNDVFATLAQTELDSTKGYLLISAVYASKGIPAENVYFTGLPNTSEDLLRTDEYGEFFAALPVGTYTLAFRPIVGEQAIPDTTVTVSARKVTALNVAIEKSSTPDHITDSGEYLIGQDAGVVKFFGVGGGGAGGGGGMPTSGGAFLTATSGGGGGRIDEASVDISEFRGQFLTVLIGAGGQGGINSSGSESSGYGEAGADGGTTTVELPNGTVIISAAGGEGGHGAGGSTTSSSRTAVGGGGGSKGVGTTISFQTSYSESTATFDDIASKGVRVFGNNKYALVSLGGSGHGGYGGAGSPPSKTFRSETGSQSSGTDGLGNGGGGNCNQEASLGNFKSGYNGGSGAVFVL